MVKGLSMQLPSRFAPGGHWTERFDEFTRCKLRALNELRCGYASLAAHYLGLVGSFLYLDRDVTEYGADPQKWKEDMAELERDLREAGY